MQTTADACTVDLTRTRIRLRDNVKFTPQTYGEETYYHIELPSGSVFYRIGWTEYVFLSLLNGHTSFCEALAVTARTLGPDALPQDQALSLYTWALEHEVADFATHEVSPEENRAKRNSSANSLQKYNPFWIRIPFGDPEPLLRRLQPLTGWLFSPLATVITVCLLLAAGFRMATDWSRFSAASRDVFAPHNWAWLLAAWLLLKTIHELAHGIVCRRYGGRVRETGVILAFFAPLAYVDVTSCWSFRSRWQRIHTAMAGIYAELLLASVAVLSWTWIESELASHLLYNMIVMASVSTIIFNANPLMRFDGYYILSDLLQIPNLSTQSSEAVQRLISRIVFGLRSSRPAAVGTHHRVLICYGLAAFAWRIFICLTMVIAASVLFHGAGIMLSVAAVLAWFAVPILQLIRRFVKIIQVHPARAVRGTLITGVAVAAIAGVLLKLPVPFASTAPGVATLPDGCVVRTDVAGFIESIHVTDGQPVRKGDLMVTLRNDEINLEYRNLQLELQQETIRYQTALNQHDAGAAKVSRGNLTALEERQQELAAQVAALQIRSPTDGTVVGRTLSTMRDTFLTEGQELLIVDNNQLRELRISVAQEDFGMSQQLAGATVPVRIGTRPRSAGRLLRVIPRASRQLTFESLAATSGGPLPVVAAESSDGRNKTELTDQRFAAIVSLNGAGFSNLTTIGERGCVSFGSRHESLGIHAYHRFRTWLRCQLETASDQLAR